MPAFPAKTRKRAHRSNRQCRSCRVPWEFRPAFDVTQITVYGTNLSSNILEPRDSSLSEESCPHFHLRSCRRKSKEWIISQEKAKTRRRGPSPGAGIPTANKEAGKEAILTLELGGAACCLGALLSYACFASRRSKSCTMN